MQLQGKVAIVTGAAQGIGKAIARTFAEHGATVVISDIQPLKGEATSKEIGHSAIFLPCDISKPEEVRVLVDTVVERFGHLDLMINNAAYNPVKPEERVSVDKYPEDIFRLVMDVDINGTFYCSKAAAIQMIKQKSGGIINIASTSGVVALRNQISHVVGKAAIVRMTQAMALELGPHGIRVNSISPGSTLTEATEKIFYSQEAAYKEFVERLLTFIPQGRPGKPDEIAQAALFLASDTASYINGHNMIVDGGWTCGYTRDF